MNDNKNIITFEEFFYLPEMARRNPEKSEGIAPRKSVMEILYEYRNDPDIYVSFTQVDKIGINPKSGYNTPLGIYAYPLQASWKRYGVPEKIKGLSLGLKLEPGQFFPFAADTASYVHILRGRNSEGFIKGLSEEHFSEEDGERYMEKLETELVHTRKLLSPNEYSSITRGADKPYENRYSNIPFGRLWYATMQCAKFFSTNNPHSNENKIGGKSSAKWNAILRSIGITGASDITGTGIIHASEPVQTVFFTQREFIEERARIPNQKKEKVFNVTSVEEFNQLVKEEKTKKIDAFGNENGSHANLFKLTVNFSKQKNPGWIKPTNENDRIFLGDTRLISVKAEAIEVQSSKIQRSTLKDCILGRDNDIKSSVIDSCWMNDENTFTDTEIILAPGWFHKRDVRDNSFTNCHIEGTPFPDGMNPIVFYGTAIGGLRSVTKEIWFERSRISNGKYENCNFSRNCKLWGGRFDGCTWVLDIRADPPEMIRDHIKWKNGKLKMPEVDESFPSKYDPKTAYVIGSTLMNKYEYTMPMVYDVLSGKAGIPDEIKGLESEKDFEL